MPEYCYVLCSSRIGSDNLHFIAVAKTLDGAKAEWVEWISREKAPKPQRDRQAFNAMAGMLEWEQRSEVEWEVKAPESIDDELGRLHFIERVVFLDGQLKGLREAV